MSNSIKRIIIPVLENATRERIIIDKAVINLFPFYLQAKGLKVFDKDGNKLLWATKTRAYIDLLGLFSKEIRIRKLTVKEPEFAVSKKDLMRIRDNIKKYLSVGEGGEFSVKLKNMKLTNGKFILQASEELKSFSGDGLFIEMVIKNAAAINLSLKDGVLQFHNMSALRYGLDGRIKIFDGRINISKLKIRSSDSTLEAKGEMFLSSDGRIRRGNFSTDAKIFIDTINKFFVLKKERDGELSFSGMIDLVSKHTSVNNTKWPEIKFDLKTKGWFYLETLMEILKVKENITGSVAINGRIHGTYPEVLGDGVVKLKDAILDTLPLDDVSGEAKYKDRRFTLNNLIAHTYNGELKGDAYILIPHGDYSVAASVTDISSPEFFKFIRWEAPFQPGKISGDFKLNKIHGQDIEVSAAVSYLNTSKSDRELVDRLSRIKGYIHLKDGIVSINNSTLSTSLSSLFINGNIDLNHKKLDMNLLLKGKDTSDLTAPYFDALKAPVRFKGKANGLFKDPEISGNVEIDSGSIKGLLLTGASADLTYRIGSLSVGLLRINQKEATYDVLGSILFRKAKKLFSFKDPFFRAKIIFKDGNTESLANALYKKFPVSGLVNGQVFVEGDLNKLTGSGDLVVKDCVVYGQQLDKIIIKTILHPKEIELQSVTAYKGKSKITAKGTISYDEKFDVSISSNNIQLSDVTMFYDYPVDALFTLDLNGSGTFKRPELKFYMNVIDSNFRGAQIGRGEIKGRLKNGELLVKVNFLDDLITANAKAIFSETTLWTVDADFKKGKYDFLLSGLLSDVPHDISASIEGAVRLKGQGNKISMQSKFSSVNFNLYGYNFRNSGDIILEFSESEFRIKSFSLIGKNADIFIDGVVKIGRKFNVTMRGNLDIAPLKAITDKITSLKGRGNFVIEVSGPWGSPEIVGEINIKDTTTSLRGFPYRIGPLNGSVFFDKNRITFNSVKTNLAGGTVVMSGAGYLERLSLKRLFFSSILSGIKLRPMEGFNAAFDGKLFYETSSKGSVLTGDINIKKAKYEKRVEWKRWLLGLKETKKETIEELSFLQKTALNIRVVGSDNIFINNNIARAPVKIDLTIVGTVARYGLLGRLEAEEGSIYFRSNEFKLMKGSSVDFVEPNNITPVFHILAETTTHGYRIKLNLDGSVDKFTLSLFSDPPLAETEILTLLTSGQVYKEAKGFESGIVASEATAILTGGFQEVVEEKFKYITGFERFEVNPYTTATGAVSPRVTVGKRLLEDKLFVIYSTSVGTTEENIIRLEYKLDKNISIIGSRNEIGSTGADIKYRFEFK